jgi:hypothetical protein
MAVLDFAQPFYAARHDRHEIVSDIDALLSTERGALTVRAIPFSSDFPPQQVLLDRNTSARWVNLQEKYDSVELYELTCASRSDGKPSARSGRFFVYWNEQFPNVYVAISLEPSWFYREGLRPLLQSLHPRLVVGFIPNARLLRLVTEFRDKCGFTDLVITRASQRLRLPEEEKHKRDMSAVTWPHRSVEGAFSWVHENNGWFQSIQFEARRNSRVAAKVTVTRDGLVKTDCLFTKVFQSFVLPVCRIHFENRSLFSKRGRRENDRLAAKPLTIEFGSDQFGDVAENAKFIQAMKRLKTASVSVLHGNPHIQLSVIDYFDGSTFDVWVLSPERVVLVPQLKATVGAIKRIVKHVFDTYSEGEVRDFEGGSV